MNILSGLGGTQPAGSLVIQGAGNLLDNNYSVAFDGIDDFLQVTDTSALNHTTPDTPFSIFLWAKFVQAYGDYALVAKTRNTNEGGYIMRYNGFNENLDIEIRSLDNVHRIYKRYDVGLFNDEQWYCFGLTYDGSLSIDGVEVYIDAAKQTAATTILDGLTINDTTVNTRKFTVGSYADGLKYMHGNIDELSVWMGYKYSESEYIELYNNRKVYDPNKLATDPSAWWRMGDDPSDSTGGGGSIKDQVSNADLNPVNMAASNIEQVTF